MGWTGHDILAGAGQLKGGAGNDRFIYIFVRDSTVGAAGRDTIQDFTTGDRIDLSAIDANGEVRTGDTAFSFGTGGFTGHVAELRVVALSNGYQAVYGDTNGDKTADFAIVVLSDHTLTAADFTL